MATFSPYRNGEATGSLQLYESTGTGGRTVTRRIIHLVNLTAVIGDSPSTTLTPPKILMTDGTYYDGTPAEFFDEFFRKLATLSRDSYRDFLYGGGFSITSEVNQ